MSELRDAKRIASSYLNDIDHCVEYKNAYVFSNSRSSGSAGGADAPIAVLKQTGEVMSEEEYFAKHGRNRIGEADC